ncbi:hypothetical protein [Micromonospora sp. AMSO31t]|uniref:hypothetical protein n=1 Tax=Micromonospora sp. AMSO31t TaxID=2650566 RepID=UPI00124AF9D7|nr:hypothetical protein [Micromonospora sp. AMSO31t]KAB1916005.1 hypothetical protein F8274_01915 [Micromonospora sp. AMSO31t]
MNQEVFGVEPLRLEIARHNWSLLRSFRGDASTLPAAVEALVCAGSDDKAREAYWRIDNVAMVQGRLSESVVPLTSCLLAGLPLAGEAARPYVFDLLAVIAGGHGDHVDSSVVGPVSAKECVRQMAECLPVFVDELFRRGNSSCVDILLMCAVFDPRLRNRVEAVFRSALQEPTCGPISDLIESSLADLD